MSEEKVENEKDGSDRNAECFKTPSTPPHTEIRGQTKWLKGCLDNALDRDGTESSYTW